VLRQFDGLVRPVRLLGAVRQGGRCRPKAPSSPSPFVRGRRRRRVVRVSKKTAVRLTGRRAGSGRRPHRRPMPASPRAPHRVRGFFDGYRQPRRRPFASGRIAIDFPPHAQSYQAIPRPAHTTPLRDPIPKPDHCAFLRPGMVLAITSVRRHGTATGMRFHAACGVPIRYPSRLKIPLKMNIRLRRGLCDPGS
jgi:hypothetical protein